jgi:DNA invertase Pin-like site-specific DNA recombinase
MPQQKAGLMDWDKRLPLRDPCPAMITSSSPMSSGFDHPNSAIDAAICVTCSSECVRAFRAKGTSRLTGIISICRRSSPKPEPPVETKRAGAAGSNFSHCRAPKPSEKSKVVRKLRCAVYTRKSSEEGLEQEFNSLHAQREACEAYIASQRSEGWVLVRDQYDDGGISGGTLERPGLKRLLEDIEDGLVDVVVVYKIDRLSRSLADFAKLVEVFDRNGVTFVSVTQSFNTTTSMGRLTLNILLSFAQFEREVTAERIRDKVRASRMKGMWMGGVPPYGYRVEGRKLVVDEDRRRRCAGSSTASSRSGRARCWRGRWRSAACAPRAATGSTRSTSTGC